METPKFLPWSRWLARHLYSMLRQTQRLQPLLYQAFQSHRIGSSPQALDFEPVKQYELSKPRSTRVALHHSSEVCTEPLTRLNWPSFTISFEGSWFPCSNLQEWQGNHYYKNDFVRHCSNINVGGGHKIQPSRKMPKDFRRRTFSFTEAVTTNRLAKCIYGGGKKIARL
jgi:hypothetical protein